MIDGVGEGITCDDSYFAVEPAHCVILIVLELVERMRLVAKCIELCEVALDCYGVDNEYLPAATIK